MIGVGKQESIICYTVNPMISLEMSNRIVDVLIQQWTYTNLEHLDLSESLQ